MTTYLALDFGTSNCVAGEISDELQLNLVPLEDNKIEMPSAIFLKNRFFINRNIDDTLLEKKIDIALKNELDREFQNLLSVEKQLNDFYSIKAPRLKIPGQYYTQNQLKFHRYVEPNDFDLALNYFKENEYKSEYARLVSSLPKRRSENEIRQHVKISLFNEMFQSDIELLREETFFTALMSTDVEILFGSEAISEYSNNPMSGFFMNSPKAFLAIKLTSQQIELFTRVVILFINHIKYKAELSFKKKYDGVVIGRPVNFMGSSFSNGNEQAVNILRTAAVNCGFNSVRFVYEPLAASLVIEHQSSTNNLDPLLVVDIGGGTTDVAFIDVSFDRQVNLNVIGVSGERIGGNDFDQSIALSKFGSSIGRNITLANSIIVDLLSTRDIHCQTKFRLSGNTLFGLLNSHPENIELLRLYQIYRAQLQHKLLLSSEKLKISLSNLDIISEDITYLTPDFMISLKKEELFDICKSHLDSIKLNILSVIPIEFRNKPIRVYVTGGMSSVVSVIKVVKESVSSNSSIRRLNALHSIVAGLSVIARQLSMSEGAYDELKMYRGVSIFK